MQIKDKIKNAFGKNRRQKLTFTASLIIVNVLVAAGVFAYFSSSDAVTNRLTAEHPSIALIEPAWDSEGQYMAKKSEPGMNIPKDPKAYNDGDISEYCRIRMTVTVENDSNPLLAGSEYNRDAKKRLYSVINAIFWDEDNTEKFIEINNDLTINKLNNPNFRLATQNESNLEANGKYDGSRSVTYYFYYTGGSDTMQVRHPDEETEELFNYVNIPVYKADYLGVFDLKYNIELQAEALPLALFEETGDPTPDVFYQNITKTT